ncbi:hypothetical protein MCHIJ_12460 [Mycolicibacterium chitae]|uniref:Anti-anti-sigma regulatory factor (Antagonist of anti-sigma factor) n=3 Tax=Mycolicibacterium TaxID=1866885 RepID=A0A448IE11_MYCCI|nr:hypothetical protein MCHIJ_12460 [Mycolicibacterium chitae]VEG50640.1 anti-anti-sigma regulatory factor (antagonist of anti-sigma factor) [Mycolicibacterium chitae]
MGWCEMTRILTVEALGRRSRRRAGPSPVSFRRATDEIATDWTDLDTARVLVSGDIDAGRTDEISSYVLNKVLLCHRLVLDLTRVRFFSCDGYAMIKTLEQRCALAAVELKVLYGPHAARAVRICEQADRHASVATS